MRRFIAAFLLFASPAVADMVMLGDLHIQAPMLRATAPNAPVGGGFLRIENIGDTDDALIAASIAGDIAGRVELHEMAMNDGVMSMFEVEGGILVPAGDTVVLAPGGLHIMLMGLREPLVEGDTHSVTLTFAEGGEITLDFPVLSLVDIRAAVEEAGVMGHGDLKHGDDDHSHHGN